MRSHWIAALAILGSVNSHAADDHADMVRHWIESNVPELMREAQMPGFAIAVVRDGETIYADAFGARDLEQNLPATTDTLFGIGSVTKSFVAIAILQLAEQGKLELDDPIAKYLPFELGDEEDPIRIRHFLTHSPGYPNLATSTIMISRGLGEGTGIPMTSADDFFRYVNGATEESVYAPGEHFFYNNSAWRMLGAIIQEISGKPFHEYITDEVMRPLGMARSTFDTDELFADGDHLTPHRRSDGRVEPANFPYPNPAENTDFSFLSAAGGISSSVTEMTAYLNMLIEQGEYPGGQLVNSRSMRDMQSLQIRRDDSYYGDYGYGFGLSITPDFLGEKLVAHGGSIAVSTAHMAVVPARRIGVVMMGNSGGMNYSAMAESVLAILMGEDPELAVPAVGIKERMAALTGKYSTYHGVQTVNVINQRGLLYLDWDGDGAQVPLIPEDPSYRMLDFYTLRDGRSAPVKFIRTDDGSVSVIVERYVYHRRGETDSGAGAH